MGAESVSVNPRAGQLPDVSDLVNVPKLVTAYYAEHPDAQLREQRVAFGTSGHRGSALSRSFNEDHIAAVSQAVCDYRARKGITGPLFVGKDTHALSEPAFATVLEVLAANEVAFMIDSRDGYTPTPAVSRAIIAYNAENQSNLSDGIVITPSHNPPEDGGIKYNPPDGGPASAEITSVIQDRANDLLVNELVEVHRIDYDLAKNIAQPYDFLDRYVSELPAVVDVEAIRGADITVGADPLGGSSVGYWQAIADEFGLALRVVNPTVDPTFRFMPMDWDGRIRMDCSSRYAMSSLLARREEFTLSVANDTDADRHGVVTSDAGLLEPNQYLATAIDYLLSHRPNWPEAMSVGKTMVSSSVIDLVVAAAGRQLVEVPVGFKWFVPGLLNGTICFAGEESAGASFLTRSGAPWTTDKDGIILALLACEITAVTGRTPSEYYRGLTERVGSSVYARIDAPATPDEKAILGSVRPEMLGVTKLAGEEITAMLTAAPGSNAALGGIKVVAPSGWFAIRPSGTENVYKLYAESFKGADHLARIQEEAQIIVKPLFGKT